jgi:hypothetical protein
MDWLRNLSRKVTMVRFSMASDNQDIGHLKKNGDFQWLIIDDAQVVILAIDDCNIVFT